MNIGKASATSTDFSSHNLIENNIFYRGGHHNLAVYSPNNVVRNNYFHNAPWMPCNGRPDGLCGNRCVAVAGNLANHNLIENNRFGFASTPVDNKYGPGIEFAGDYNITRRNDFFDNGAAAVVLIDKFYNARDQYVYHNSMYHNGYRHANTRAHGGVVSIGTTRHFIRNNVMHDNKNGNTVTGNLGGIEVVGNWMEQGDPLFVDADHTQIGPFGPLPDLSLQSGSPVIDAAVELTTVHANDAGGSTLKVNDAHYFQDGTWGSVLSPVEADWIAVGDPANVSEIASISYSADEIHLSCRFQEVPAILSGYSRIHQENAYSLEMALTLERTSANKA